MQDQGTGLAHPPGRHRNGDGERQTFCPWCVDSDIGVPACSAPAGMTNLLPFHDRMSNVRTQRSGLSLFSAGVFGRRLAGWLAWVPRDARTWEFAKEILSPAESATGGFRSRLQSGSFKIFSPTTRHGRTKPVVPRSLEDICADCGGGEPVGRKLRLKGPVRALEMYLTRIT